MSTRLGLLALPALWLALTPPPGRTCGRPAAPDLWSGEYRVLGGWAGHHQARVTISKKGNSYRLNLKGYEGYSFTEVRPGVLECKRLGKIYRGSLRFDNEPKAATRVLRADLCYEHFYLFAAPAGGAGPKAPPKG